MKFSEIAPIPRLRPVVECIWTLESVPGAPLNRVEPVLPDGCPELVMQFGEAFDRVFTTGRRERQSRLLFAGQLTSQLELQPTGTVATLGVRFRPGSAAAILHMPQHPLQGTTLAVDALDSHLARELAAVRDGSHTLADAVDRVQHVLCRRLDTTWLDSRVLAAVGIIRQQHGQVRVDTVARHTETTRRHLERRFDETVGITPKRLARIVRFQRALKLLDARPDGVTTALACGYADQPHFIREFTELAGCPPGAHRLRHAQLSGFFTGSADF